LEKVKRGKNPPEAFISLYSVIEETGPFRPRARQRPKTALQPSVKIVSTGIQIETIAHLKV
ncbi:MAG: hypothetical protein ACRDBM_13950, partial [Sporomusa sp.]